MRKKIEQASPVPAAQELLAYIRKHHDKGKLPAFCEKHGLDRLKVQRAINGDLTRIDVDFAFAVEDATGGEVKAEGWRVDEDLLAELQRWREDRNARRVGVASDEPAPDSSPRATVEGSKAS